MHIITVIIIIMCLCLLRVCIYFQLYMFILDQCTMYISIHAWKYSTVLLLQRTKREQLRLMYIASYTAGNTRWLFLSSHHALSNQAQKCYCGSASCRGYIGQSKQNSTTSLKVLSSAQDPTSPRSPRERRRGRIRLLSDADNAVSSNCALGDIIHDCTCICVLESHD